MKVKVRDGFQINHQGKIHTGGASLDVSDALAKRWVASGLATKAVSGSKNKAVAPEQAENKADDLSSKSRTELYELAQERDIEGRSSMDKDQLIEALEAE